MIEKKEPNRQFKPSKGTEVNNIVKTNVSGIEVKRKIEKVVK